MWFTLLKKTDIKLIQESLMDLSTARDNIFEFSRISIRSSGSAIVELHRGNIEKAATHLRNAESSIRDLEGILRKRNELKCMGNVTVAYQEYAEAKLLYGIITKNKLFSLKEVDVKIEPYLLGLLDFLGELRRRCLNFLKEGENLTLEKASNIVSKIYRYTVFDLCNKLFVSSARDILAIFRYLVTTGEEPVKIEYFISKEMMFITI